MFIKFRILTEAYLTINYAAGHFDQLSRFPGIELGLRPSQIKAS
jgi:hypothetical protein